MSPVPLVQLEPNYPYGGGTDNPGDNTAIAGGPTDYQATETAPIQPVPRVNDDSYHNPLGPITPAIAATISQQGTDTILPAGMQAVPPSGAGFEPAQEYGGLDEADPSGGIDPIYGDPRESGQDETQGETETTSGESPTQFPEPTP